MTEFISRNYGNKEFEVIIKTDDSEHYDAAIGFARKLIDHEKPMVPWHENLYDISEMAYRNGYAQGLEDGRCKWVPASLFVPQTHEVRTQDFEDIIVSEVSDPVLGWDGKRMEVVEYEHWNGKHHWSTWNGTEFDVKYWTELPKVPE